MVTVLAAAFAHERPSAAEADGIMVISARIRVAAAITVAGIVLLGMY